MGHTSPSPHALVTHDPGLYVFFPQGGIKALSYEGLWAWCVSCNTVSACAQSPGPTGLLMPHAGMLYMRQDFSVNLTPEIALFSYPFDKFTASLL